MNKSKRIRHIISLLMIVFMVGMAELTKEKEIIFPELVALTVGLWIIDKRVWKVKRWQIVFLMTLAATAGVCIVRYSPFPQVANMTLAFAFAACCLLFTRSTFIPLVSACMLPVLLHTHKWIYPETVFVLSLMLVGIQAAMEKTGLRHKTEYTPAPKAIERGIGKWISLLLVVFLCCLLAYSTKMNFLIIPPLIVTFVELATSKAGFRNRPIQVFLFLVFAVFMGTVFQLIGYQYLGLPQTIIALLIALCLFGFFELAGKYFAPAGALAFVPTIIPQENLTALPLQATIGAALFIIVAMVVYMKCFKWTRAQFVYSITPTLLRQYIKRKKE